MRWRLRLCGREVTRCRGIWVEAMAAGAESDGAMRSVHVQVGCLRLKGDRLRLLVLYRQRARGERIVLVGAHMHRYRLWLRFYHVEVARLD